MEDLLNSSEELLKVCGLSRGQVIRVKAASAQFEKDVAEVP